MSKITFRADDDLVDRVEALDASKSEVMRDALRRYLDREGGSADDIAVVDELVAERVDRVLDERGDAARDLTVNVTVEHDGVTHDGREPGRRADRTAAPGRQRGDQPAMGAAEESTPATGGGATAGSGATDGACARCGEALSDGHVFCPNCGEKASRRLFCECGDELRSDWAYCPGCGRRTPSAEVLDG